MQNQLFEQFGRYLVGCIRDAAIRSCDAATDPNATHAKARCWKQLIADGDARRLLHAVIPDIVDEVLFLVVNEIDHRAFPSLYRGPGGETIDLAEEGLGELADLYAVDEDGWRERCSTERYWTHPGEASELKVPARE